MGIDMTQVYPQFDLAEFGFIFDRGNQIPEMIVRFFELLDEHGPSDRMPASINDTVDRVIDRSIIGHRIVRR